VLLDAMDTVLPSYPPRLRRRARRDLEGLGVELRLGTQVVGVDGTGLDIERGRIEARTKIWAAGVQASSLGRLLADRAQATVDRAGRVEVAPDPDHSANRDLGTMVTISRFRAVVGIGPIRIVGLAGWLRWRLVHLVFITGFKNRVAAVADWAVAFLGRGRRQRTITEQQVLARARVLAKQ
jgi:NADH:ubiquinone reductase (H+-translocating)